MYFPVVGTIVVALIVTVAVAWARGEAGNTTLHTVAKPPASLAIATPAASAQVAWRTNDRAAIGNPRYQGTVVVYGKHAVRGLDARTGSQTWSYTRSNRSVCAAAQTTYTDAHSRTHGATIAVYRVGGNCDEVTALASGTGRRIWTRTLDEDGQPLNGTPSFQVTSSTFVATTSSVSYSIDASSGIDRWVYSRYGCTIERVVPGASGALISQTCTNPRCSGLKFCGRGPQLLLRGNTAASDDNKSNPDQIIWNLIGNTDVPVSADSTVSALNTTTRSLSLFDATTGKANGSTVLTPAPATAGVITALAAGSSELATVRGVAAALGGDPGRPAWSLAVSAPLTAVPVMDSADLTLDNARVTVPSSTGAAVLDANTGRVVRQVTLSPRPAAGSSIFPLGTGQLAAGAGGTVAYR